MHGIVKEKTYYKNEHDAARLRIGGGSWSINLSEVPSFIEKAVYLTETSRYSIEMKKAREKGFLKSLGGEVKLVVPLEHWEVSIHAL